MELSRKFEVLAHPLHAAGEFANRLEYRWTLQLAVVQVQVRE
jgi:hypothetical protein